MLSRAGSDVPIVDQVSPNTPPRQMANQTLSAATVHISAFWRGGLRESEKCGYGSRTLVLAIAYGGLGGQD